MSQHSISSLIAQSHAAAPTGNHRPQHHTRPHCIPHVSMPIPRLEPRPAAAKHSPTSHNLITALLRPRTFLHCQPQHQLTSSPHHLITETWEAIALEAGANTGSRKWWISSPVDPSHELDAGVCVLPTGIDIAVMECSSDTFCEIRSSSATTPAANPWM